MPAPPARLQKQQREQRALARLAEAEHERRMRRLDESEHGAALRALIGRLTGEPVDAWPGLIAPATWLRSADPDFRFLALRLIGGEHDRQLSAQGLDPLDGPLPWDPPSPWTLIQRLLSDPPATAPTATPSTRRPPLLTIHISGPADVPNLLATLNALTAQLGGSTALSTPRQTAEALPAGDAAGTDAPKRGRGRPPKNPDAAPAAEPTREEVEAAQAVAGEDADQRPAVEPEDESQDPADAAPAAAYTTEQISAALQNYARTAGPVALKKVLDAVGAKRMSEIPAEKYAEVMKQVGA